MHHILHYNILHVFDNRKTYDSKKHKNMCLNFNIKTFLKTFFTSMVCIDEQGVWLKTPGRK